MARDALLQAYAPSASRLADALDTHMSISDGWETQSQVHLTAAHKLKAEGTRAEEESVPRHGRRGPSVQGGFKRLSDLPVFPKQSRSDR